MYIVNLASITKLLGMVYSHEYMGLAYDKQVLVIVLYNILCAKLKQVPSYGGE